MAWQLIYTSAPRGLVPGRSGFSTVARHREIRDGLVTAIERFSQYDRSGNSGDDLGPVVYAHRIVRLGGSAYHVLSCTRDAGADYTGRTNHLAHHLICEPHELAAAPSPAEVLRQMTWLRVWSDAPRFFGTKEVTNLSDFASKIKLPAKEWQAVTRDAGCAALPLESGALAGCFWLYPPEAGEQYLLSLFAESLLLLDPSGRSPEKRWQIPFTTYLQSTDDGAEFVWRGCWHGSPAAAAAQGARQTFDVTQPLRAPASEAAALARTGETPTPPPALAGAAPAEPALSDAHATPPLQAEPGGGEIDLAELLASADSACGAKRRWAKTGSGADSKAGDATTASSHANRSRKLPLKLIITAGAAIVVAGVLAIGFVMWRDGRAETIRGQLARARNGGDFAKGPALIATTSGIFRSYEPLKVEIERTLVAADLEALKTPEDSTRYFVTHRERLTAPAIQGDSQIKGRLDKIERWRKTDQSLGDLDALITAPTSPVMPSIETTKAKLAELEKEIDALDPRYRPTLADRLAETKRASISRRFEKLKASAKSAASLDNLLAEDSKLIEDAKALGMTDLVGKIGEVRKQQRDTQTPHKQEPQATPVAPAGVLAKTEESKTLLGLPVMTTYIAIQAGKTLNISSVDEMQKWTALPNTETVRLFHQPAPPLNPSKDQGRDASMSNGKLYDGGKALLSLRKPELAIFDDDAKAVLGRSFGLLFAGASGRFYVYCGEAGERSAPLVTLPRRGWVDWDKEFGGIILKAELVAALARIRLAGSPMGEFIFRAQGWGERELPFSLREKDGMLAIRLSPVIDAVERDVSLRSSLPQPPKTQSVESRVRAAKAARDLLMGKDDPTGLSRAGLAVFDGKDYGLDTNNPLATTDAYVNSVKGLNKETLKNGRAYIDYTKELFKTLSAQIAREIDNVKAESSKLDRTKGRDQAEIKRLDKRSSNLQHQKIAVDGILASFAKELPESLPGFNQQRCNKAIEIWTNLASLNRFEHGPAKPFRDNWRKVFTLENIERIRPFLEWNLDGQHDGDLDQAVARLTEAKPVPSEPTEDKLAVLLKKLKNDFIDLGPFSIDIKTVEGTVVRLVSFSEVVEDAKNSK